MILFSCVCVIDFFFFLKVLSDQYLVFLQVDGAQEVKILKAGQTADFVQRQVENLQIVQILQPFNLLQLVPPLDTDRERGTRLRTRQGRDLHEYAGVLLHTVNDSHS